MSANKKDVDLLEKLKDVFESITGDPMPDDYPQEAMPLGTLVRANRLNRLGAITDAFYGEMDQAGQKIIIYTLLLFPKPNGLSGVTKRSSQYYLTNEYEYEITGYLMMNPINLSKLAPDLGGNLSL
jgi:hypothetical protein